MRRLDRLGGVRRLADHLEPVGLQEGAGKATERRLVIDDEDRWPMPSILVPPGDV